MVTELLKLPAAVPDVPASAVPAGCLGHVAVVACLDPAEPARPSPASFVALRWGWGTGGLGCVLCSLPEGFLAAAAASARADA